MAVRSKTLRIGDSTRVFPSVYATGEVGPKWAFQQNFDRDARRQQERNGVPVWTVQCVSLGYGDFSVTIPAPSEPRFAPETPIVLMGLVVGASPSGNLWFAADGVAAAEALTKRAAA